MKRIMNIKLLLALAMAAALLVPLGACGATVTIPIQPTDTGTPILPAPTQTATTSNPISSSTAGSTTNPAIGTSASAPTAGGPSLQIIRPYDGQAFPTGSITIRVQMDNFTLDSPGSPNQPNHGHLHFTLDTMPGNETGGHDSFVYTSDIWEAVPPGVHTFYAELSNNDHTMLNPPVVTSVTVNVTASAQPGIAILEPKSSATLSAGDITVTVNVDNFQLLQNATDVPGTGHIVYLMDTPLPVPALTPDTATSSSTTGTASSATTSGMSATSTDTSHTWTGVSAGQHTFGAILVDYQGNPIGQGGIGDEVTVTVK